MPKQYELPEIDIDNLHYGRITRGAMAYAVKLASKHKQFKRAELGISDSISTFSDMILAEELNRLLEKYKKGGV